MLDSIGLGCIQYDKDTILKAIYNTQEFMEKRTPAVFSMTKIQFWKQFTTVCIWSYTLCRCIQYDKDTILKAIYNSTHHQIRIQTLYSVWQRYNFESNLQLSAKTCLRKRSCIQYDKDTILKAIYNSIWLFNSLYNAVFSMTKIQFWKQFTTLRLIDLGRCWLYSVWQRYNFESNLQLPVLMLI